MKKINSLILVFTFLILSCQQPGGDTGIRWVDESVEYAGLCVQTYRAAWQFVESQANATDENWAVVLDVDETVLNNTGYQKELFETGVGHSADRWDAWTRREEATPVPGAKIFLDQVRALSEKAQVVFITNRTAGQEEVTKNNLKKYGLWSDNDVLMGKKNSDDSKEVRRQEVITGSGRCEGKGPRKIIALFGDQLADLEAPQKSDSMKNMREAYVTRGEWGARYFMFPNPMYGYWERGY